MSSPLVTGGCLAFKSNLNGKYLSYMPEHGELQVSGEDAINPHSRFYAEPSKKHDGYVHIRCCYNNKYWVAHQVNDDWCIIGDANEPEEDLTKHSCTLFRHESSGDNSDHCSFQHAGLTGAVYMLADSHPTERTLRAGSLLIGKTDKPNEGAYMFSVINLQDKEWVLPKHVCFMGDNDKYLSGQYIESHNYLRFSSDDIGDPTVRNTIHYNSDGTVRIKSDHFGKFWRRSPNWIWADSNDTTSNNPDTLFQVVKFGDIFALRNLGNDYYCTRLTTEGKESCLNASVPTINKWAYLRLQEPVLSRRIYNLEYDINAAKIYGNKVLTMTSAQAVNSSSTPNKVKLTLKYSVMKQRQWDSSVSLKLGVKTTIQAGVPEIMSSSIEIQTEIATSYTWGESKTLTEEHSIDYEVIVSPRTKATVRVLATQGSCDVPFSYYQEDILTDGKKVVSKFNDGIYRGVNSYDFTYAVTEEKL